MSEQHPHPMPLDEVSDELTFPVRVACIDVGSNALRFVAAEFSAPDRYLTIEQERAAVRLGHDVFMTGHLTGGGINRAVAALTAFAKRMRDADVDVYRCVATSAVRESSNSRDFVDRVRKEAGINIEVISGSEEARLLHVAVRHAVDLAGHNWIVVDVGGGSVEVLLVDDSGILWSESHTMGSVRLLEELSEAGEEPGRFRRLLEEYTATLRLPPAAQYRRQGGFIATGGNAETLAQLGGTGGGPGKPPELTLDVARTIIEKLSKLSYRQRVEELGLREDRADVVLPAALVYERLAQLSGASSIVVPGVGIKEGVLYDVVEAVTTQRTHADRQERDLVTALVAIGRRYMFDEAHASQVAKHSLSLFDRMQDLHTLDGSDRKILQAAAWLHDIGAHISYKRHHKHSMYLIAQCELPGFSDAEVALAASVARYHRKSEPAPNHPEFAGLGAGDQRRVLALAAILRLADALDREHLDRVRAVSVEVKGGDVVLGLDGKGDLLLEKWALRRKAPMFERVYECKVRVRNGVGD
ncbi:MAG TPA: Ppx/GppA phosphatase family protein [Thermoanaerobaculaceae bacterium]|nr:Ppx/GppA phosphatase family protein [Thermoanaerobaculaceae bacterium]